MPKTSCVNKLVSLSLFALGNLYKLKHIKMLIETEQKRKSIAVKTGFRTEIVLGIGLIR